MRAYVAAINGRRYARAWRLGGRNTGASYSQFVSGFGTTARDALTVVSVSRHVVTARITARQTDGTVALPLTSVGRLGSPSIVRSPSSFERSAHLTVHHVETRSGRYVVEPSAQPLHGYSARRSQVG